jgi:hypothetical protein
VKNQGKGRRRREKKSLGTKKKQGRRRKRRKKEELGTERVQAIRYGGGPPEIAHCLCGGFSL